MNNGYPVESLLKNILQMDFKILVDKINIAKNNLTYIRVERATRKIHENDNIVNI